MMLRNVLSNIADNPISHGIRYLSTKNNTENFFQFRISID